VKTKKVEIDNEKESLLTTVDNQNNIIEEMKKQMQEMQKAFVTLQSNNGQVETDNDKTVFIGCRFINGVTVYSPKRDVEVFIPYGDNNKVEMSVNEVKMCLKSNFVKDFLRKDVLYFENEEDYKTFKIFNRVELDDDKLINLLSSKNQNALVSELNKYTRDKKDDPVFHSIFYRIVKLSMDGKLGQMSYENRKTIEDYFQFSIDNGQMLIANIEKVK
jgi:hypothetical protein